MLDTPASNIDGKKVVIIHPAWHSCGSHAVFCCQAAAYRALGARVLSVAVGTTLEQRSLNRGFWSSYYDATGDMVADERYHTGPSRYTILLDGRFKRALQLLGSDYATQMAGLSEMSPLPAGLASHDDIDLIHCNHYFNMPLALRLKAQLGAPILLETHDVQSRQYDLRGARRLFSGQRSSLAEMEASELALVGKADVLAHINADELAYFSQRLPQHRHVLLYPALRETRVEHEHYFLAVASANHPNFLSISWLLERVLPLAAPVNLVVVGNIDREFQSRVPALYAQHRHVFRGRIDDLQGYYDRAAGVLLPVVAGHGLAIKTVEALKSGAPLISTRTAFRGIGIDLDGIDNLRLADTPVQFARQIDEASSEAAEVASIFAEAEATPGGAPGRRKSQAEVQRTIRANASSRKVYTELFSFPSYVERLERVARGALMARGARAMVPAAVEDPDGGPYRGVAVP